MRAAQPASAPLSLRRHRRLSRVLFSFAAGVAVILVIAGVWAVVRPAPLIELASATLDAFPAHPGAEGQAMILETSDGALELKVELDADAADDGYREVWLIRADASDLVSLGVLQGREGVFEVPQGIDLRDFVLVDVSQELDDGDPAHSGDSIVRGELRFT